MPPPRRPGRSTQGNQGDQGDQGNQAVRTTQIGQAPRTPWLTLAITALTTGGLVLQETVPGTLERLQRSPQAVHGDWWRWLTALVTQDGGVAGGVFNIAGLLLCGVAAEWMVSRRVWLVAYVGAGLAGEVFGQAWQPVGAGNSVAVCGLAGLLVVVLLRAGSYPTHPPLVRVAPVVWCGAMASGLWSPLLWVAVVAGIAVGGPLRAARWTRWVATSACIAAAVALLVSRDIHGGALSTTLVAAAVTGQVRPALLAGPDSSAGAL